MTTEIKIEQTEHVEIKEEALDHMEDDELVFYVDRITPDDEKYDPPKWLSDQISNMVCDGMQNAFRGQQPTHYHPLDNYGAAIDVKCLNIADTYVVPRARVERSLAFTMDEMKQYERSRVRIELEPIRKKRKLEDEACPPPEDIYAAPTGPDTE